MALFTALWIKVFEMTETTHQRKPSWLCLLVFLTILPVTCFATPTATKNTYATTSLSDQRKSASNEKRPNIIFILTEDMRYDDIAINNRWGILRTPNIDNLARNGVIFDNIFCTSPLCHPITVPHNPSFFRP